MSVQLSAFLKSKTRFRFRSYPYFPEITEEVLKRVEELGGTHYVPPFGTWKGNLLRNLVGWKATKRLNVLLSGR
jgi:hypothetical protein